MKKITAISISIIAAAIAFCSCEKQPYLTHAEQEMVIEGWIDNGGFPYVFLSKTVLADGTAASINDIDKYTVKDATVTINDGTRDYELVGIDINEAIRKLKEAGIENIPFDNIEDVALLPPYVYTTALCIGQVGKTYKVTAVSGDYKITGTSTIQTPVEIEKAWYEKVTDDPSDDRYKVVVKFTDNPDTHDYYKAFVMVEGGKPMYMPSLLANLDDDVLKKDGSIKKEGNSIEMSIYQDFTIPISEFQAYFHKGDVVSVKLVKINQKEFKYWDVLEELTIFSRNMFFPTTTQIQATVDGGEGYWCAYGSSYVTVSIGE